MGVGVQKSQKCYDVVYEWSLRTIAHIFVAFSEKLNFTLRGEPNVATRWPQTPILMLKYDGCE